MLTASIILPWKGSLLLMALLVTITRGAGHPISPSSTPRIAATDAALEIASSAPATESLPSSTPAPARPPLHQALTGWDPKGPCAGILTAPDVDLDEDIDKWHVYPEGNPKWVLQQVITPSLDGTALRCGITDGDPYSNVHCYRNMPPQPAATVFTLTLSFYYSPTTTFNNDRAPSTVQALEFAMNKWHQGKRYEWALQWMNVGTGAPQWRYWDPHRPERWIPLLPGATVSSEQWHALTLEGEILDGQTYYCRFTLDGQTYDLNRSVQPVPATGEPDRLAVAVQVDGNYAETPYDLFVDRIKLLWGVKHRVCLPLVLK